jgi:hypothetical protein
MVAFDWLKALLKPFIGVLIGRYNVVIRQMVACDWLIIAALFRHCWLVIGLYIIIYIYINIYIYKCMYAWNLCCYSKFYDTHDCDGCMCVCMLFDVCHVWYECYVW